jgi:23S rRNA (guanosine2251-2'-O)-methyltransferase
VLLLGINPVREALLAGRPLDRILVAKGAGGQRLQEIIDLSRQAGIPVRFEPRPALDRAANNGVHQGVLAFPTAAPAKRPDSSNFENASLLVVLDGVEDPHNLGAIVRTANAAGAGGVLVPERRASGITETVVKASAGAIEYTPVIRVVNISRTLEDLKQRGFWIYGLDERGEHLHSDIEYASPAAFVFGGEGKGLHELVKKHCDFLVRIPMAGKIASLNVSVAAGVVLFEFRRRVNI